MAFLLIYKTIRMKIQKRNSAYLMMRNGNQTLYATGKLGAILTIGLVGMFVLFGIAAVKSACQANNNRLN